MKISFIREVRNAERLLADLYARAIEEGSQFTSGIHQAHWNIEHIIKTYDEVLKRDADEDVSYTPPLKEIK